MPLTVFLNNKDGLNVTDSLLSIKDSQATGQSYNYNYETTGAITKTLGPTTLNITPDTQLKTLGLGVHHDVISDGRTVLRAAGTKIQTFAPTTGVTINQTADTVAGSTDFLTSSTQQVIFSTFNTLVGGTVTWMAGGGLSEISGYTGTNITANGTPPSTGSISTLVNPSAGGTFDTTGTYFYAVTFRKLGTQVIGNAALDVDATISSTTDTVTIDLTTITNNDTTRYDKIYIYRSAVGGVSGFTTGDLIAKVNSTATSYTDTGTFITTATNVPRAGSTILDNSQLPSGVYKSLTSFKRRLVTAVDSTFYLSDLDKPESWPLTNSITIPTGGPINAVGTIGVPSEYTTGADQYLCIWKERELWVLTGTSFEDWALLFVDRTGCITQSLVVSLNGLVTWLTFNGVYIWDGKGKPTRVSKFVQGLFMADGDLDKTKMLYGAGVHYEKGNAVIWRLSHRTKGLQTYTLRLDTKLTSSSAYKSDTNLSAPEAEGIFTQEFSSNAIYAMTSYRPANSEEVLLIADDLGFVYSMFTSSNTVVEFTYETRPLDMGIPQNNKKFKRLLVYLEKLTINDLQVFYWADNRVREEYQSLVRATMAPNKGTQPALWDIALWDQAFWDDYTPDISPIEFNFHDYENNAVGSSIKIRFKQIDTNAPVRIHAFAIDWEDAGPIPIPTSQIT